MNVVSYGKIQSESLCCKRPRSCRRKLPNCDHEPTVSNRHAYGKRGTTTRHVYGKLFHTTFCSSSSVKTAQLNLADWHHQTKERDKAWVNRHSRCGSGSRTRNPGQFLQGRSEFQDQENRIQS